jgi:hypothetical protein
MFRSHHVVAMLVALLLVAVTLTAARAGFVCGIVALHGKQGMGDGPTTMPILQALRNAGYTIQSPTMC